MQEIRREKKKEKKMISKKYLISIQQKKSLISIQQKIV